MGSFFFNENGALPATAESGIYIIPLVVLSYLVASFASFTALSLVQQLVNAETARAKKLLFWGGAFVMGAGIWAMHFIGMLSYKMRMAISYDPWITLLSLVIAIGFACGVLKIVTRERLVMSQLATGAVLLGLGISAMHYTGMAAMRMDADLRYIPSIFFMSIGVAIFASGAALWMAFSLARHRGWYRDLYQLLAALIMGAAICGMHYVGMWAAVFLPWANCRFDPEQNFGVLALALAVIMTLILGIALAVSIFRRHQSDARLQASETRLRAMIDSAHDAVIAMDSHGRVTEWNKQAENIFGWTHAEAVGKDLANMIIPPDLREAHNKGMARFISEGIGPIIGRRLELQAMNRTAAMFPVELTVSAHRLPYEYHFTAFVRDITDRRNTEARIAGYMKELEHSNQELESFAHIASHDLKEPLRGLYSQASFLLEDYQDKLDAQGVHRLNRLSYLAKRMERLVNDLLYFSQLGQTELAIQETDMNVQIDEIRQMLDLLLKEKNARIVVPKPLPVIVCDRPRATEAFRNLITNALKYNDKKEPVVEIGFLDEKDGERNVFYVRDNGVGIDKMFHEEIFHIFKRLEHSAEEKESGTGVGLTFVKKIIERHDGRIWLESEPGVGTTFYFTLHPPKGLA